ncbi:MAG: restriction endonuclease subunit S [Methanobrevibacter sp.]|nr:restriction endonuclease subunit S [Methanobrevibacter sp.]
MSETKNVPKLRFRGFNEEWEEKKFGDVFEFYQTNSFPRSKLNYERENVYNIHYGDIHKKFPTLLDLNESEVPFINDDVDLSNIDEKSYLKEGDLLIADASEDYEDIGKAVEIGNIYNKKVLGGLHTFLARDNYKLTKKGYRRYILLNSLIKLEIKKIATGISVLGISKTNLGKIIIKIPSIDEQEKIANFLSKVDEKINFLKDELGYLNDFKKFCLQQLFAQKLRFADKNKNYFSDWEENILGSLGNTFTGLSGKTKEDFGKGKPYITYKSIFDSQKIDINRVEFVNIDSDETQNKVEYGDIFFTTSSETPDEVGMASVLLNSLEECYLNSFSFGFRINSFKKINPEFFSFYLRSHIIRNEIKKLAQGSTRFNLSKNALMKINILIPTLQEQEKITNFLSAIDKKIELMENKIAKMEEFKKGLLQQMLI